MTDVEIQAVRKARHQISAECDHDVRKVAAYCREVGERIRQTTKKQTGKPAPQRSRRIRRTVQR
jgi:hypothetical protein